MQTEQKYYKLSVSVSISEREKTRKYIWVYDTEEKRDKQILTPWLGGCNDCYNFQMAIEEEQVKKFFPIELGNAIYIRDEV